MLQIWKLWLSNLQDSRHYSNQIMPLLESREQREGTKAALHNTASYWPYCEREVTWKVWDNWETHSLSPLRFTLYCLNYHFSVFCAELLTEESGVSENYNCRVYPWRIGGENGYPPNMLPNHMLQHFHLMLSEVWFRIRLWKVCPKYRAGGSGVRSIPTSRRPWYYGWKAEGIGGE